jgi:hypothetical protein
MWLLVAVVVEETPLADKRFDFLCISFQIWIIYLSFLS